MLQKNLNLETRFPVDLRIGRKLPHLRMLMSAHILALEPVLANVLGGLAEAQRQRFRTEYLAALGTPGCVLFIQQVHRDGT